MAYADFLRKRGIPISSAGDDGDAKEALQLCDLTEQMVTNDQVLAEVDAFNNATRKQLETDRDMMIKGLQAFLGFVRSFQEHQLQFIFRAKEWIFGRLATGFGLLRMPKMKEMKATQGRVEGFVPSK